MRNGRKIIAALLFTTGFSLPVLAQQVQPQDIGVVEAPTAGNAAVSAPPDILHSAEVAMTKYDGGATVMSSHLDKDDVMAIWEVQGSTDGGRMIEIDVRPDGTDRRTGARGCGRPGSTHDARPRSASRSSATCGGLAQHPYVNLVCKPSMI